MKFKTFQSEKDQKFYFNLQDNNLVVLRSQAYGNKQLRDNGIRSIINNYDSNSRYDRQLSVDGKHFFNLNSRTGEVIGTSVFFNTSEEMESLIQRLQSSSLDFGRGANPESFSSIFFGGGKGKAESENVSNITDATIEEDASAPEKEVIKSGTFNKMSYESFKSNKDGKYYFHFLLPDGKVFLRSQEYNNIPDCENGIQFVMRNAAEASKYKWLVSANGKNYFELIDNSGKAIATSMMYEDKNILQKAATGLGGAGLLAGLAGGAAAFSKGRNQKVEDIKRPEPPKVDPVKPKPVDPISKKESAMDRLEKKIEAKSSKVETTKIDPKKGDAPKVETPKVVPPKKEIPKVESKNSAYSSTSSTSSSTSSSSTSTSYNTPSKPVLIPPAPEAVKKGSRFGRNWWWLGALLIGAYLLSYFKGCGPFAGDMDTKIADRDKERKAKIAEDKRKADAEAAAGTRDIDSAATLGPDAETMGLPAGSLAANIANFLSDGSSGDSKRFPLETVRFNTNSSKLTSASRRGLDKIATILEAHPDATIDIYGYVGTRENSTFGGGKEMTLGDVRARSISEYLSTKGISRSRMSFEGAGRNADKVPEVIFNKQ